MISLKNWNYLSDKNKPNSKTNSVNLSPLNMMLQKKQEKKLRLLKSHSLSKNHHLLQKVQHEFYLLKTIEHKSLKVLPEGQQDKNLVSNSSGKQNSRIISFNKNIRKQEKRRTAQPFAHIRDESKKLSLHPKSSCQKNSCQIINLLNLFKNDQVVHHGSQLLDQNITENINISEMIKNKNYSNSQQKLRNQIKNTKQSQIFVQGQSDFRQSRLKCLEGSSRKKLDFVSKVSQIQILPWQKKGQRINVEIQTIQNQEEYFEYLVYKRKKEKYQQQLKDFFDQVQMVKQDRQKIDKRNDQMSEIYKQQPQDDRESRIFELKRDMLKQEQKIEKIINEKYQKDEIQLRQIQQIQIVILAGLNKLDEMLKNQFLVLKQVFENLSNPKYLRIVDRIRSLISHVLSEVTKQINYQIKKSKVYKKQSANLRNSFDQYIDINNEYKQLLKNCFDHLKKTPELCYKLFGDTSQQTSKTINLKDSNNDFQKPKCLFCFNTHWKLNTVAEQNILMKSVLKVTQQLLK